MFKKLFLSVYRCKKNKNFKVFAFQDTEPVKVVTGIRRCGKSSLLKLMTLHLKENGIADDIGSNISVSSIGNTLMNEGLLENDRKKGKPSTHTVQAYVNALLEAYFFYDIKRFDIKGKEFLRTLGKYYIW